uniref:Uncharacterized protein n=1 Tax=Arundo donax TaxID=35708 RepID=A0A0A9EGP7_ARUDO
MACSAPTPASTARRCCTRRWARRTSCSRTAARRRGTRSCQRARRCSGWIRTTPAAARNARRGPW